MCAIPISLRHIPLLSTTFPPCWRAISFSAQSASESLRRSTWQSSMEQTKSDSAEYLCAGFRSATARERDDQSARLGRRTKQRYLAESDWKTGKYKSGGTSLRFSGVTDSSRQCRRGTESFRHQPTPSCQCRRRNSRSLGDTSSPRP